MHKSPTTTPANSGQVKKLVAFSTIAQMIGQVVNALAGIIILRTMTSSLGVHDYGLYATILAYVSTFSLLTDLGLNGITGRDIAKNPDDASSIISHNMGLRLFLCIIVIPLILIFSYLLYPHGERTIHTGILIASIYLLFDAIRSVALAYFTAKIRNDITAFIGVLQQLSFLMLVIAVSIKHGNLYGYLSAYVLSNFIAALAALYTTKKEIDVMPRVNLQIWRTIMARSIMLGIIIVINMLYLKADSIMLSIMRGPSSVAIYGIAYSLIIMLMAVPSYLMTALIPTMTTSTKENFESVIQQTVQVMTLFSCLLVIGSWSVKDTIVLVISNQHFAAAAGPFAILAIASAISALCSVFGFASVSVNKHHKIVYAAIFCLLLNISINFFFIPKYNYNGAAWATVITEVFSLASLYYVFHKETGVTVKIRYAFKPIALALPVLISCLLLNKIWVTPSPLLNTFVSGTYTTVLYGVLLYVCNALPIDIKQYIESKVSNIRSR